QCAEAGELRDRDRLAVDPRAASPLRVLLPAQHELAGAIFRVGGESFGFEPCARRGAVGNVEYRRELGTCVCTPELERVEAPAEEQRKRVDENRLAGARLAGEYGESGL